MTLGNSSLSVDFGDNCSITAALHPGQGTAAGSIEDSTDCGDSEGIVQILQDNYGLTCQLRIEISHVYRTEGDFNISVMARSAAATAMVKNWTLMSVRSPIEDLSLLVDSVVAVPQNVTVSASVSPVSQFVKYYWTLSVFDVMQGVVNSSVIQSAVTDIPELRLMLTDVGDYRIDVMVVNEIDAVNDSIIISSLVPVSTLSLSCSDDKYFSTNATVDCTATVAEGTDVGFVWNLEGGVSTHIKSDNNSSTASVTYPSVGWYNVTVTAWNQLGSESAWQMVNVAENVFRLSAWAMEPVLVGKPITVVACCMRGSNLTVEFDFVSGNHKLVLDHEARVIAASHVYRLAGVHTVTVTAQNSMSVAVTHVTVNVLENVADVDLKPLFPPVAGRHSVFMATFNGNFLILFSFI